MGYLNLRLIVATLLAAVLLTATPAAAQSDVSGSEAAGDAESLLFLEIPSVYAASKYEQKATEAPAKVSIVTADEIEHYGYRTLEEILRSLPGFHTTWDRNYSYVGIRGFGIPGDYDTRYLLLVDGHRINDSVYDSAYADYGFVLDVDLIERVEVVRGPSSSLYGSSAFFGVVNVITKKGRDLNGIQISADAGSLDSYRGRLSYGNRFDNGLEVLVSGTYFESQGNHRLYYSEFDDPATNNGVAEDADGEEFGTFFAKLSFKSFTLEGAWVDREKVIPTAPYETIFNDPRTQTTDGHSYLDLKYQALAANGTDVTARLFYDRYWYAGDWAYDYSDEGDLSYIEVGHDSADGEWWGAEVQAAHQFTRHRLIAGGELRDNLRQDQKEWDSDEVYLDNKTDSYTWALFLQDEITLRDNLILNLGLRYDYFSTVGSTTNPRAALIWSPYENTNVKMLYGTAFRAPNSYELYYFDGGFTQKPALSLDSETIETWELVLDQQLSRHLRGAISIYSNEIENLIALTTDPADGLLVFENLDDVNAEGGEIEVNGAWDHGWSGALSYSYQRAESSVTGEPLVNFPSHMVKLNLIAPLAGEGFTAGLVMLYESERGTIGGGKTDDNLITNLMLFSEKWADWLKVSIGVYNLFDSDYAHPASQEHEQDQIPQDGRTFRVKAVFTF